MRQARKALQLAIALGVLTSLAAFVLEAFWTFQFLKAPHALKEQWRTLVLEGLCRPLVWVYGVQIAAYLYFLIWVVLISVKPRDRFKTPAKVMVTK